MKLKPADDPGYAQTHFVAGQAIRVEAGGDYETDDEGLIAALKEAGWKQVKAAAKDGGGKGNGDKGKGK